MASIRTDNVAILSIARTPIGKYGGVFRNLSAHRLAAEAVKGAISKIGLEPDMISEVVIGSSLQGGLGGNPARLAAYLAGIPPEIPAYTVNTVCSSGMEALYLASRSVLAGDCRIVVAGGMESMSNAPFLILPKWKWGVKYSFNGEKIIDLMVHDGLTDPFTGRLLAIEAEMTAKKYGITREMADRYAVMSHHRAAKATDEGCFRDEIVPIEVDGYIVEKDEGIRPDTNMEKVSKLKPVFLEDGIITPANASQLSDGAATLVVSSIECAEKLGIKPIARILGFASIGLHPKNFVETPIPAVRKLLETLNMDIGDFDLYEHNEAFALATIIAAEQLGIPYEKLNVHGGAIALGHPLAASGARIVVTLINALKIRGLKRGIATLCDAGGGGQAVAVELM